MDKTSLSARWRVTEEGFGGSRGAGGKILASIGEFPPPPHGVAVGAGRKSSKTAEKHGPSAVKSPARHTTRIGEYAIPTKPLQCTRFLQKGLLRLYMI
jgi:hypothetical protein